MQAVDAGQCKRLHILTLVSGILAAALLALAAIAAAAYIVLYMTPGYMEKEYDKYDVLSSLPEMTKSDLMAVNDHMMDFLISADLPEDLQIEVRMGGELRGFFSEREILHMWDVRQIFRAFIYGSIAALTLALILAAVFRRDMFSFGTGLTVGVIISITALAAILILGGDNFSELFVNFHLLVFDNDLWLLDPREDMLINIVPEGFFYDTFIRIAAVWGILMALLAAGGMALRRGHGHKNLSPKAL